MAQLTGPDWMDELLLVLFGIRTAPKEDLSCSSAELVYGAPLTVSGDFIPALRTTTLVRLRARVDKLSPIPVSQHSLSSRYVPPTPHNSQYVFLRRKPHHTAFQRPYEGPFQVLQNDNKAFIIEYGCRRETASVDRLKPAHLNIDKPVLVAQPLRKGRPPS